jgi:hypothetical protein
MFQKRIKRVARVAKRTAAGLAAMVLAAPVLLAAPPATAISPFDASGNFSVTRFSYPASTGYTSMDIELTPEAADGPDGYAFWHQANFVCTPTCESFARIGLQTVGTSAFGSGGKVAVFSLYDGNLAVGPQYAAPLTPNEGTGYSVRIKYNWQINHTYRLRIYRHASASSSNGDFWAGSIIDTTTGIESFIGRIRLPRLNTRLANASLTVHERYSGPTINCTDMYYSKIRFTNPHMNTATTSVTPAAMNLTEKLGSACDALFQAQTIPGGMRGVIGGPMDYTAGRLDIAIAGAPVSAGSASFFSSSTRPVGDCGTKQIAPSSCFSPVRHSVVLPVGNPDLKTIMYPSIEGTPLGYAFNGWTGACVGGTQPFGGCIVHTPIGATQTITANFVPDTRAAVRVNVSGLTPGLTTGFASTAAVGSCGTSWSAPGRTCFGAGTQNVGNTSGTVIIYPDPNNTPTGYRFTGWSGDACVGGTQAFGGCKVFVASGQAKAITANYVVKTP